ncbi:Signal transduction histidine kinase [Chryseolinea serpens]|uniref:histidine kinase n=1 Tax=Chryseolinea serpens TaxID=947013 RepID=A0A1M5RI35_9BACT|nr:HAMP domain-containing sensor histidine kinase [Chryseolinea serpens]SHH25975.1 Signal transduction histidine kinase [Chryseolinea serpens]
MLKFFELNSIRSRMVSGFLFLTFLILVLSLVSIYIMENTSRVAGIHSKISQLEIYTLNLIKSDNDFFDLEVTNEDYFKTRQSHFLKVRDSLNAFVKVELAGLLHEIRRNDYSIQSNLLSLDSTLMLYNRKFDRLEGLVYQKGFKDYGLEGEMRLHAHALEELDIDNHNIVNILNLRRHEKDFFLRHDTAYIGAFQERYAVLHTALQNSKNNAEGISHLDEYRRIFLQLAAIQKAIGLSSHDGVRSELNTLTSSLSNQYYRLSNYSYDKSLSAQDNGRIFYFITLIGAIFFSLLSGYWISKRLSEPIARLSRLVDDALNSRSEKRTDFTMRNAANEINTLTSSFILLMDQARDQMKDIRGKSKELKTKNKQLRALNRELDNFLYSTAHDLRSPLSSLLGLINLMRYENKDGSLKEYLAMMEKSIHRSEYFISQIVNFSKNKRMKIAPEPIQLDVLIEEIFEQNSFVEGFDRIERRVNINHNHVFYSDKNRVTILFNNLISNAIRYADVTKENSFIEINARISPTEIAIVFGDNGIGIQPEHLDKIFDMFYRADYNSKGTGLGLFIFRETIKRLNGDVRVESQPDVGTNFFLRLPNLYRPITSDAEAELLSKMPLESHSN